MAKQTQEQAIAEIWQLFRETSAQFKETDAFLKNRFRETDERFRETDARLDERFRETDAEIRSVQGLFTSQWGKMIEALVQPNALKLFQERGIKVRYVFPRAKSELNGNSMEVDLILEDGDDVVVVEAKSTLSVEDVREFLDQLAEFTTFFPKYKGYHIYGAVAGLNIVEQADRFAYKQGMYVLSIVGDGMVKIKNDTKFQPHNFGQVE